MDIASGIQADFSALSAIAGILTNATRRISLTDTLKLPHSFTHGQSVYLPQGRYRPDLNCGHLYHDASPRPDNACEWTEAKGAGLEDGLERSWEQDPERKRLKRETQKAEPN